jgi:hypothetical protein
MANMKVEGPHLPSQILQSSPPPRQIHGNMGGRGVIPTNNSSSNISPLNQSNGNPSTGLKNENLSNRNIRNLTTETAPFSPDIFTPFKNMKNIRYFDDTGILDPNKLHPEDLKKLKPENFFALVKGKDGIHDIHAHVKFAEALANNQLEIVDEHGNLVENFRVNLISAADFSKLADVIGETITKFVQNSTVQEQKTEEKHHEEHHEIKAATKEAPHITQKQIHKKNSSNASELINLTKIISSFVAKAMHGEDKAAREKFAEEDKAQLIKNQEISSARLKDEIENTVIESDAAKQTEEAREARLRDEGVATRTPMNNKPNDMIFKP